MAKGKFQKWLEPHMLRRIEGWKRAGLSDEQVAKNMNIAYSTLKVWINTFPAISDVIKNSREDVVNELENALIKRARGFEYTEVTRELRFNQETGKHELQVTKSVTKRMAPDTGAIAFALKNWSPEKWRERRDEILSGDVGVTIVDDLPKTRKTE